MSYTVMTSEVRTFVGEGSTTGEAIKEAYLMAEHSGHKGPIIGVQTTMNVLSVDEGEGFWYTFTLTLHTGRI